MGDDHFAGETCKPQRSAKFSSASLSQKDGSDPWRLKDSFHKDSGRDPLINFGNKGHCERPSRHRRGFLGQNTLRTKAAYNATAKIEGALLILTFARKSYRKHRCNDQNHSYSRKVHRADLMNIQASCQLKSYEHSSIMSTVLKRL